MKTDGMSTDLVQIETDRLIAVAARLPRLDITAIKSRVADVECVISELMIPGVHFGKPYPGAPKDSLLQPGAELMVEAFGLVPCPTVTEIPCENAHMRFIVHGTLETPAGTVVGHMQAECSTLEPKYRYRKQGRVCPTCGAEAIMASRYPDKATGEKGWYCNKKADGCGANFPPADPQITEQEAGRVENPDPAELYHTCSAMAQKRWLVAIVRRTFALSARFVDAEAARSALFDWNRAKALLRALPGERREKWGRVVAECLRQFGKPPEELTALEGSVIVGELAQSLPRGAPLIASDFMESPEAPKAEPENAAEPKPEPDPSQAAEVAERLLKAAGALDTFVEQHGPPADWTADVVAEAHDVCQRGKE